MDGLTRRSMLAGTAGMSAALAVGGQPAQAQTPKRGGTVTVALTQAPPSLDAQLTSAQVARDINLHMYETLYARDENDGARNLLLVDATLDDGFQFGELFGRKPDFVRSRQGHLGRTRFARQGNLCQQRTCDTCERWQSHRRCKTHLKFSWRCRDFSRRVPRCQLRHHPA